MISGRSASALRYDVTDAEGRRVARFFTREAAMRRALEKSRRKGGGWHVYREPRHEHMATFVSGRRL